MSGQPDGSYRSFELLYLCFTVTPVIAGLGKLFDFLVNWELYVSSPVARFAGGNIRGLINGLGVAEIILGLAVAFNPFWGGWATACWLWLGAANMLMTSPLHDGLAVCFVAMSLGAVALAYLARDFSRR